MRDSERIARDALVTVGDPSLGEWTELGRHGIVHVRRRLRAATEAAAYGLTVRDIRGTDDERERLAIVRAEGGFA